jgi:hypothetical protein
MEAAAVSRERSISANQTMTGDDDANGIGSIRVADGADRGGLANFLCEAAVGEGGAGWYSAQRSPNFVLKGRAASSDGNGVNGMDVAPEVRFEAIADGPGSARNQADGGAMTKAQHSEHSNFEVFPIENAEVRFPVDYDEHRSDGAGNAVEEEGRFGGRLVEDHVLIIKQQDRPGGMYSREEDQPW